MRKLFTLVCAMLASFSLWAADYTPAVTSVYTVGDAETLGASWAKKNQKANYFEVVDTVVFSPFVNYSSNGDNYQKWTGSTGGSSTSATWEAKDCFRGSTAWFSSDAKAATVRTSRYYLYNVTNCTEVKALLKSSGTIKMTLAAYEIEEGAVSETAAQSTDFTETSIGVATIKNLDAAKTYQVKVISDNSGTNTVFYEIAFVHPHPCTNPEFTVSPTEGTGFVGDPIDITISSKNQSKPINAAVTVDGVAGVYGTDYTFSASTGLVQATPLKAGTFVITFSQASNGTYCDAEESATFVISEKAAVTSFEVEGPTSARVGDEVTLTAKNFDAAATSIWWTDKYGQTLVSTAEYTFTPEAEGTIELTAWAENEFNTNPVTVAHNVTVTIGHNALLSDLKVNGATIDGFADDKFEYDLGEIGVYEPVKVEATPADAPYATATVNPGNNNVLITVFAQDQTTYKSYVIKYTRAAATELVAVSDSLTWDWLKAGNKTAAFDGTTLPTNLEEFNFADVLSGQDASFKAASLVGRGQYANNGYGQLNMLKFHADKAGTIVVEFSNTGSSDRPDRVLLVNDVQTEYKSKTSATHVTTDKIEVAAGDVVIEALEMKETPAKNMIRIYLLTYVPGTATALDNTPDAVKATKRIENGQLIIEKNGETYNVLGTRVR